ncbi:MAG: ABC transporter substrate-binding protein [Ostreibacterium sp.]
MLNSSRKFLLGTAISAVLVSNAFAGKVEVLHYWTSGGEAAAAAALKSELEKEGHEWTDFAVAGGGGDNAMTVLKSRAVSGNPPSAAQVKGPSIQDWAELGLLMNLDDVATPEKWDEILPKVVSKIMKYKGHYVAVPVNVHRVNWLWANPEVFKKAGAKIPTTWDEFFVAADKIKAAGLIALAHGGQPWQDATVFEDILLGMGGVEFYKKALIDLDPKALGSDEMVKILTAFKKLKSYTDAASAGREWNITTGMVINGQAAMQIMGDWAKGEFTAAGKKPGKDYVCIASPGTKEDFIFNIDSMIMFDTKNKENKKATKDLAKLILQPHFQKVFNMNKGSIPVRTDLPMDDFDSCAKLSSKDFKQSATLGTLVPSMAHEMAVSSAERGAIMDTVTNFFNSKKETPQETAKKLVKAVKMAM